MAQPELKEEQEEVVVVPATKPPAVPDSNRPLTPPEKAAVIIALLGAESAGPIVEKIEDKHMRTFMYALENLQQLPLGRHGVNAVVDTEENQHQWLYADDVPRTSAL